MLGLIDRGFEATREALEASQRILRTKVAAVATTLTECFRSGGKVLVCGNGGSAADAQHFAAEFVGRFKRAERPGLPAIALCADSATMTAWSNDVGFDDVFARQVDAFGTPGDVLVVLSTSGRSGNLVRALERARLQGLHSVAILGRGGGDARPLADIAVVVPAEDTQRIQEVQILILHLLCELVEEQMFSERRLEAVASAGSEIWQPPRLRRSRRAAAHA